MIRSFEGVRGMAAILITLYHFGVASRLAPIGYGYLFVDLFFVLSGFVIVSTYSPRISTGADLKPFLIRRFGRLFPLMMISTLLFVLAFNLSVVAKQAALSAGLVGLVKNPGALAYMAPDLAQIAGTAFFLQGMGIFDAPTLNYVSWSISTEFYTYILFAAVWIALPGRARWMACAVLAVLGLGITEWAGLDAGCTVHGNCNSATYDFGFPRCVGSFFLGAIVARLAHMRALDGNRAQLASLVALATFFACVSTHPALVFAFPALCALLIASLRRDRGFLACLLQLPFFQMLGQRSFSIYMLHPVVLLFLTPMGTVANRSGALAQVLAIGLYLFVIVVVAGWSYTRIEVPSRDWFSRLAAREHDVAQAQPVPAR